jgi:hypothetical protein
MSRGLLLRPFVGTLSSGAHAKLGVGTAVCDGSGCNPGDLIMTVSTFAKCTLQAGSNNPAPPGNESIS